MPVYHHLRGERGMGHGRRLRLASSGFSLSGLQVASTQILRTAYLRHPSGRLTAQVAVLGFNGSVHQLHASAEEMAEAVQWPPQ